MEIIIPKGCWDSGISESFYREIQKKQNIWCPRGALISKNIKRHQNLNIVQMSFTGGPLGTRRQKKIFSSFNKQSTYNFLIIRRAFITKQNFNYPEECPLLVLRGHFSILKNSIRIYRLASFFVKPSRAHPLQNISSPNTACLILALC